MRDLETSPGKKLPVGDKRAINWIMPIYLVTGLVGSLFLGVLFLRDSGYITFEPYEYYATQYFLLMGLAILMGFGWIVAVVLIILYRHYWSVITPALMLIAVRLISFVSTVLANFGVVLPYMAEAEYAAIHLYCISALLIGGWWLFRRIARQYDTLSKH